MSFSPLEYGDLNLFWDKTHGRLGVGTDAPTALFSVGSGSPFVVDASGNVTTSGDITLSSTSSVLIWDGDTGLSRISPAIIGAGNGTAGDVSGGFKGSAARFTDGADLGFSQPSIVSVADNGIYAWSSDGTVFGTVDTGLTRDAAGVVDVGNGTHGNKTGQLNLTNLGFVGTTEAGYVLPDVGGTAGWVMLGTWVAASAGDSIGIKIFAGAGFNTGANGEFIAELTSRTGNDSAAPNLDGIAYRVWGGTDWQTAQATTGFAGVKFVATGSSTSPTNRSWDIWVSVSAFSPGCFTVAMDAGDTFTYSGTTGSDPGSAAYIVAGVPATEVTGTIYLANLNWTGLLDGTVAGNTDLLQLVNSNPATSLVSQGSPALNLQGSYWNGSASANDIWTIATSVNGGTNGNSMLVFQHSGSSGNALVAVPNLLIENSGATGAVALSFNGASSSFPTATFPDNSGTVAELNLAQTWTAPQIFASYTVSGLPTGAEGQVAYATNGRKVGEGVGSGTGVPVYFSNSLWRVYSTDAQVQA